MTLFALLLVLSLAAETQPQPTQPAPAAATPQPAAATPAQPIRLPTTWHGTWRGDCTAITTSNRPALNFTMQLRVAPIADRPDRLTWEITYEGGAGNQVRPYELIALENEPNRFVIDEKNGILIDAGLLGSTIASHFTVQSAMITATYRLEPAVAEAGAAGTPPRPDRIIVELTTFKADDSVRTSGGGPAGSGAMPEVKSWRVSGVQRAELVRQP